MTESTETTEETTPAMLARAKRIKMVVDAVNDAGGPIPLADIAIQTGLSERLVTSTMHVVNRTLNPDNPQDGMFVYNYRPAGYTIARSWADRERWHLTLHKHAATRTESLLAEADVALALWPDQAPQGLQEAYAQAQFALDRATRYLASLEGADERTPTPRASRGVKLVP